MATRLQNLRPRHKSVVESLAYLIHHSHGYHHRHTSHHPQMWNLPTGRSVEDVLFSWVVSQSDEARRVGQVPRESYAHSYILDVEDPDIKLLFDDKEWGIIVSRLLPLPTVGDSLRSFMYKFADAKNTSELRHLLISTPYLSPDETYSLEKHGDQAWVHSALSSLVILYEHNLMSSNDNLEAWFQINVWGPIFDRCFQHIPNISVKRTESQSLSNTTRKNPRPPIITRKCIGNRYDGLITHNRLEYGAVEDSKDYEYKKWASDSLKLVKVLHDQLRGLETEARHVTTALQRFRCVGFLTAGKLPIALFPDQKGELTHNSIDRARVSWTVHAVWWRARVSAQPQ
ncbi:hypothetical protein DFP73DRAFT_127719 [Morchella snyderi]|nr:hypothetical protein DFP73DRAFT_127719 [Morchella snyderi]